MFKNCLSVLVICIALVCSSASFAQPKDVTFTLDFIPLGRHAPWYVALAKGYYKDEGLNVTIAPGKGTADAIRAVESGSAQIGFIDIPSLVAAGHDDTLIRMVAVNYQRPPYSVFSLSTGANIARPQDMVGKEFSAGNASLIPRIHQAFMKLNNVDPSSLKIVNIEPGSLVAALATRKIQSIGLFAMSEQAIKRAVEGAEVKHMLLADHGLDIYAIGIGVRDDYLQANPEIVRGFVRASLKGWKDTLANPEEAARLQAQIIKTLNPSVIVEEIDVLKKLAIVPDTEKNGFGHVDPAKLKRTVDFINNNFDVPRKRYIAEELFRSGYLPKEPVRP